MLKKVFYKVVTLGISSEKDLRSQDGRGVVLKFSTENLFRITYIFQGSYFRNLFINKTLENNVKTGCLNLLPNEKKLSLTFYLFDDFLRDSKNFERFFNQSKQRKDYLLTSSFRKFFPSQILILFTPFFSKLQKILNSMFKGFTKFFACFL